MIERMYESHIDSNRRNHDEPSNVEGIHYLAVWHLERQSYHQVSIFLIFYNKLVSILIVMYIHLMTKQYNIKLLNNIIHRQRNILFN